MTTARHLVLSIFLYRTFLFFSPLSLVHSLHACELTLSVYSDCYFLSTIRTVPAPLSLRSEALSRRARGVRRERSRATPRVLTSDGNAAIGRLFPVPDSENRSNNNRFFFLINSPHIFIVTIQSEPKTAKRKPSHSLSSGCSKVHNTFRFLFANYRLPGASESRAETARRH